MPSRLPRSEKTRSNIEEVDLRRRELFRALLPEASTEPLDSRRPMAAERIALVREIAARWDGRLPQGAVPHVQVSDACSHHGVCVSVCPTAALRTYAGEGHTGLEFHAAACIACGVCAVACPEKAISIRAGSPAQGQPDAATRISRHAQRSCVRCDDAFAARADDELCPACRKDVGLFTHGFSARSDER